MIEMDKKSWNLLFIAWIVALAATLGALFIGEIMGKTPCVLCWYQRIFMFPLAIIIGIGLLKSDPNIKYYALPFSIGGLAIAGFHSLLYLKLIPENPAPCEAMGPPCSGIEMAILGGVPIPLLSAVAFGLITFFLAIIHRKEST